MNNSLRSIIDPAKEILVLLPTNPTFDDVASGLALYLSLIGEKTTFVSCPTPMTVEYNRLVGVNKIKSELGGKNLTVRLVGYPSKSIEKVSYDIVNDEFRLMVIPKDGVNPPGDDQVQLSYSGVSADTIILVGGRSDGDFPALSSDELGKSKVAHIGIRSLENNRGAGILSLAKPSSSISELVATLIKESDLKLDSDIATNLFVGIQKATNGLMTSEVSADTYETVAILLRSGAQRQLPESNLKASSRFPFSNMVSGETENVKNTDEDEAPKDWLEPKVFRGTSTNDSNKLG